MEILQTVSSTVASTLTGAVVGAIVAFVLKSLGDSKRGYDEKAEGQYEISKLLGMNLCKTLTHKAVADGEITIEDRAFVNDLVSATHKLGANGEMTACKEIVDNLPTKK